MVKAASNNCGQPARFVNTVFARFVVAWQRLNVAGATFAGTAGAETAAPATDDPLMRSADAQIAMLKWLNDVTDEHPNPTNRIELWRVRKGERELTCVADLPTGIDVRLMEGADFQRTQLVRDAPECEKLSQTWRAVLVERGWEEVHVLAD